jgi:hypothetical protein
MMQSIAINHTQNDQVRVYTTMAAVFLASLMMMGFYAKFTCDLGQLKAGQTIECWRILY